MENQKPLDFHYDEQSDVITIEGFKYSGSLFRELGGGLAKGQLFMLLDRTVMGAVVIRKVTVETDLTAPPPPVVTPKHPLLSIDFTGKPDGLIADEFKTKTHPDIVMNSGSLYVKQGQGWTGIPDVKNNSAKFRLLTTWNDWVNASLKLDLTVEKMVSSTKWPALAYDGVHLIPRYATEDSLYSASINRRDQKAIIKKKIPGGPSNGGTYFPLTTEIPFTWSVGKTQPVEARVKNLTNGNVEITLLAGGVVVARAVDDGTLGGSPIKGPAAVCLRGDNFQYTFNKLTVEAI